MKNMRICDDSSPSASHRSPLLEMGRSLGDLEADHVQGEGDGVDGVAEDGQPIELGRAAEG